MGEAVDVWGDAVLKSLGVIRFYMFDFSNMQNETRRYSKENR